ncbi:MAG: ABC transporter substrate-binding protein [Desulfonatronospira sp. MSAO_Bac3]|nr:MAG: ABC transporter substrate-binding protein [Desulfonatronospira sp. MSAO_Bac3]
MLLSPTTSTPKLSGIKDNFFRIQPSTDQHAIALARYVFHEKEIDTLCTLRDMDNEIYADSFEKHFVQEFKSAGGEVTNRKKLYASRSQDWLQIADDLQLCSEQGLFLAVSGRDVVNLVQAIESTGLSPDIFSSGWAMTRELLRAGGRTVENMTFVTTTSQENLGTDYYEFAKNYRSRFGSEPSFAAAMAYDAAHILALALEESSGDRGLEQALTEIRDYPGLYWPITIDEYGDVTSPVTIVQVREGEFEEVYSFKAEDFE